MEDTGFHFQQYQWGFHQVIQVQKSSIWLQVQNLKKQKGILDLERSRERTVNERVTLLYSCWSVLLTESIDEADKYLQKLGLSRSTLPDAPHLENCKMRVGLNERHDKRRESDNFPPWTSWKGSLDMFPAAASNEQMKNSRHWAPSEGAYPPWITGSDEENYPLTRKVQRDIWIHQHPLDCKDPDVKFLVADWERIPGFGIGAQLAGMCGLLAIAINERRVLVTNYYNRADHDGCKGSSRTSWSCYFFPETSWECRERAFELMRSEEAWRKGIITQKENYTSKKIWAGPTPRVWGDPWSYLQPTTEVNGSLLATHRKMDQRWWRAQAIRYLMRFPTEYTCGLLNVARHAAFGKLSAQMVLESLIGEWPKEITSKQRFQIDEYVWSNHKPWIPRPLLSIHVRMGDKACEMKVVEFEDYMRLADRIRKHFPHLNSIWLSTEMQEVIDKSKKYTHWNFYYTNVTRQVGNMTMATYEASLGRETSTNYPLVNFLMAAEADFFIGALGSTWCFLIDGMRNTGGKVMAGYLSVNKDRFW
ncbi:Alpha-(1,6)-fucosyltransferase [Quillaja saponaria]|uniref:Alpha-(1,6)-fucosyltransferase n=1 Tax=Quillaja saponaria TaxID=32244 RepID=A0AAD7QC51_QUISA|nr:Alpha-(1,6)-fucosyltransferase [Quillaja saponaria]